MLECIIVGAILVVDQIVKYLSETFLSPLGTSFSVIPGVFQFTSAHNTGAAWGMLPGRRWFFLALTFLVCAGLLLFIVFYRKKMTVLARATLSLLLGGALGNAIDRLILGYVRDTFDFCLISFPVFNIADSALTIGCILLIADVLFMKEKSLFEIKLRNEPKPAASDADGNG